MDARSPEELLRQAAARSSRGEPYALATVVWARPPTSAKPGDRALVTGDGELHGWIGGGCSEGAVIRQCLRAIRERSPRLLHLGPAGELPEPRPGRIAEPIGCASEGALEVFVEPHLPRPLLIVVGDAPAARALERMAGAIDFEVMAIDAGPDEPLDPRFREAAGRPETYVVIATMGRYDEPALRAALATEADYIGLVGSRKRARAVLDVLRSSGVDEEQLARVRSPAGLDLGRVEHSEIAVAVLAEIVGLRAAARGSPAGPEPATEVDPICGMAVDPTTARFTAQHQGRTVYFCSAGCRERFPVEPSRRAGSE